MPVTVETVSEVTPELVEAFARLIPQLSTSNPPPDAAALAAVVAAEANTLFVARTEDGTVAGTLTLCTFPIPTATRAWIEDVVVDSAVGRGGVGTMLVQAALDRAVALGAKTVDLTSRPSREAANALYLKLGFDLRTTNCYRWSAPA